MAYLCGSASVSLSLLASGDVLFGQVDGWKTENGIYSGDAESNADRTWISSIFSMSGGEMEVFFISSCHQSASDGWLAARPPTRPLSPRQSLDETPGPRAVGLLASP